MERLTDDRFLKDAFYQPKSKDEEKEIRYMANDLTFEKLYKHCAEVEKENAKQKAEIERLNLAVEGLTATNKVVDKENSELIEERENMQAVIFGLEEDKRLLQRQVDELKANKVIECHGMLKGCDMVKQAVKDTAKEIFTDLLKEFSIRKSCGNADVVVREMATRKGVEVE